MTHLDLQNNFIITHFDSLLFCFMPHKIAKMSGTNLTNNYNIIKDNAILFIIMAHKYNKLCFAWIQNTQK